MTISTRVRLTADRRRAQLVKEASAMIAESGFQGFSIAGLAQRCSISRAGVLHHFESREELLIEVLNEKERESEELTNDFLEREGAREARAVLDLLVRHNIARPEHMRLLAVLSAEALTSTHPAHDYFKMRMRRGAQQLTPLLGGFDRSPYDVAIEILSFMDGLQLTWLRDPDVDLWDRWTSFADAYFARRP
ncbi:TetR/AcrR family transcriptional regulator [Leifsonia sp. Root4]|uniref:TetR/AcrR family transcriptional regulator n=1 Tax=Leifsonia sp. Root4 TaxID=1736525 RepID=UPI0009E6893D|nr:TetR/AcrR family transcriptional regulator [Leifsonia sp. Root4]